MAVNLQVKEPVKLARAAVLFYVGVAAILICLIIKLQAEVLPSGIAAQLGHNSEALLFALLVGLEIQYLRPALSRSSNKWPFGLGIAALLFAIAYGLLQTGWTSSVVTLNEPIVAAGFMMPFLLLKRPQRFAPAIFLAVLALVIVFFDTVFVLDQAESLVPFMLAPLALDVFDRTILEPHEPDRPALRLAWMVTLVVIGVAFMITAPWAREDLHGPLRYGIDYGQRAAEAYWGWLLVHAYFSFWLRQRGGGTHLGREPQSA